MWHILVYAWSPTSSEFYLQRFCLHGAILEELSNQRRSKQIGDDGETKETEPYVLQRQQNKGAKGWRSGGRGIMLGKLLVKDKLLHSGKYRWTRSWDPWRKERNEEQSSAIHTSKEVTKMWWNDLQFPHKTVTYIIHSFIPVFSLPKRDWIQWYWKI